MWTLSNTPKPGQTPPTTPNCSSIASCTFTQPHNKVLISYDGMPHTHSQNCPFLWGDRHLMYLPLPWTPPTHHPKWHPGPFSRFSTIHWTDGLTHDTCYVTCTNTHLCCIWWRDAANNICMMWIMEMDRSVWRAMEISGDYALPGVWSSCNSTARVSPVGLIILSFFTFKSKSGLALHCPFCSSLRFSIVDTAWHHVIVLLFLSIRFVEFTSVFIVVAVF